jgi:hypothetical protein
MLLQHQNCDTTLETDISLRNIYGRIYEQTAESLSASTNEKCKDALISCTKLNMFSVCTFVETDCG